MSPDVSFSPRPPKIRNGDPVWVREKSLPLKESVSCPCGAKRENPPSQREEEKICVRKSERKKQCLRAAVGYIQGSESTSRSAPLPFAGVSSLSFDKGLPITFPPKEQEPHPRGRDRSLFLHLCVRVCGSLVSLTHWVLGGRPTTKLLFASCDLAIFTRPAKPTAGTMLRPCITSIPPVCRGCPQPRHFSRRNSLPPMGKLVPTSEVFLDRKPRARAALFVDDEPGI